MQEVRGTELRSVNVVKRLDERPRFLTGDHPLVLAANASNDELKRKRTRASRRIDNVGRAKIRLMIVNERGFDFPEARSLVCLQTDQPRRVVCGGIFHLG